MPYKSKRKQQAKTLRVFRKVHRTMGIFLFVFFFFMSVSGILLGWKKNSNGLLLPKTHTGTSTDLKEWIPMHELTAIANKVVLDAVGNNRPAELNRIDIRKEKGSVKFIYKSHNIGVQLDGATGKVLNIGKRHSDIIENIHDGSIIDDFLGSKGYFKLFYATIMGVALLLFTITGFWLWYGPKRMKRAK